METNNIGISEASLLLDVSINTLRNWDKSGKLTANKTEGGHRRYTLEQICHKKREILKIDKKRLEKDFFYFTEFIKVRDPMRGLIPFEPYSYHKKLFYEYENNRFNITKKFRQGGISTFNMIYALWKAIHNPFCIVVLSKTQRESEYLKRICEGLFDSELEVTSRSNSNCIEFKSHGMINFLSPMEMRGRASHYFFVDEAAFIENMDYHWKCWYPCMSKAEDSKVFVYSTPSGIGNWFYDTWDGALKGTNSFNPIELDFMEHPLYKDKEWLEGIRKTLGEKCFRQEMLGEFVI